MNHLQTVAEQVRGLCPGGDAVATLTADMTEADVVGLELSCGQGEPGRTAPRVGGLSAYTISSALMEQRSLMTIPGQTPWSRCTFTLFPDGRFKFDIKYDD